MAKSVARAVDLPVLPPPTMSIGGDRAVLETIDHGGFRVADLERLARANDYVVRANQALLGLIAPAVEGVSVEVEDDEVLFRFWADGDSTEVAQDADRVVARMQALGYPDAPQISVEFLPGVPTPDAPWWAGRILHWSKAPPAPDDE